MLRKRRDFGCGAFFVGIVATPLLCPMRCIVWLAMTKSVLVSDEDIKALQDDGGHFEVLTVLSGRALQRNDPFRAFIFADRRCRIASPRFHDLILRGEALRRLGFAASASADLDRALAIDPADPLVNARAMAAGHESALTAARWVVSDPRAGESIVKQAVELLHDHGRPVVGRLVVEGDRLTGWVACRGSEVFVLVVATSAGDVRIPLQPNSAPAPLTARSEALVAIDHRLNGVFVGVDVLADERPTAEGYVPVRVNPASEAAILAPVTAPSSDPTARPSVTVIVPIYDDVDVTRACLDSLAAQATQAIDIRVLLVDDASPSNEMSAMVAAFSARHGFGLIVNARNLGFIGAVNAALDRIESGDVLLLNADIVLPPSAIAKLAAASRERPGIGIVNPLTNDGQFNSFPTPDASNLFENPGRITAIDRAAADLGTDQIVPTPGGIGYCMYITRACLDAVGKIPEIYLRGYYEDVEFCLRAAERGFASVCALDVYVGHKGTSSFKGEKLRLVTRNDRALRGRFPTHEAECRAFRRADPMRTARAQLEARIAPIGHIEVVVAGSATYAAVLDDRAATLHEAGISVVVITWSAINGRTRARLRLAAEKEARQSDFPLQAAVVQEDLVEALTRMQPARIEITGPAGPFAASLSALLAGGLDLGVLLGESLGRSTPVERGCPSVDEAEPCAACLQRFDVNWTPQGIGQLLAHSLQQGTEHRPALIVPVNAMAQELANDLASDVFRESRFERFVAPPPVTRAARGDSRSILALLYPEVDLATERFLLALASAALRAELGWAFVLIGRSLNDRRLMSTGNLFVAGAVPPADCPDVLAHYGAAALFAPQRWTGYGLLARLAEELEMPKAYFDWSIGAVPAQYPDLSIDPRVCNPKAAGAVCDWLAGPVADWAP